MKRDPELIRAILIRLEEQEDPMSLLRAEQVNGYDPELVSYHIDLMRQAGLLEAIDLRTMSCYKWAAKRITWDGHEFLDAAKNDAVWQKTMSKVKQAGSAVSISILKQLLVKVASAHFGLE